MPGKAKSKQRRTVTSWHAVELEILRDQLTPLGCHLSAPVAIGKQPPEIDAVVDSPQVFPHQPGTLWNLVNLFRAHNVLEIKSVAESFNPRMLYKLSGYTNLYLWQEDHQETETAAIALVTHVPREVLKQFSWRKLARGFYQMKRGVLYSVVAVNELPVRPEYYPLLMLASGQKREEFLEAILRGGERYYLDYALLLNYEEVYNMAEKIGALPTWTLEESVLGLIAHGNLDPEVLLQRIIRERGVEPVVKEALARELLTDLGVDNEAVQRLLDERPKHRPRKRTSR
jgi:hypothetical protein